MKYLYIILQLFHALSVILLLLVRHLIIVRVTWIFKSIDNHYVKIFYSNNKK